MILAEATINENGDSKPRASGDDPTILAAILGVAAVNPARAGMIPQT